MSEHGVFIEELQEQVGKDYDVFDLICHVAFDQPPLTRKERAENVKKQHYFAKYGDVARAALEALLDKYAREGIQNIEDIEVLKIPPFDTIGSPIEIVNSFGGRDEYLKALKELEEIIYKAA